jgi:tRNA A-37 threonylcarbamoyl transferase component Bud32
MAEIPTADWSRINAAADCFERAWKAGPRPRIEDYLAEAEPELRAALLEELVRVERELRRGEGEDPAPEEYSLRFSQQADLIRAVFGPGPDRPDAEGQRPGPATTAPVPTNGHAEANGEPPPGTHIRYFGDYEIQAEIGRGGMGVVYKARQISLNRPVALKMIRAAALASEDEIRRFQNEAEAVARLDHPHIVPVYEIGEHDGRRYFSMKLIAGPSLQESLSSFTGDPKAAARLMVTIAEAVHHAHQRGILHRDLKPSNILLDEQGRPHVTDFGLAKRVEGDEVMTLSGAVLGTPAYMAPEQAGGKRRLVTTLSDVYGLGAVLYALLTGAAPFGGESAVETLDRVRREPPVPPSRVNPKVPLDLETICLKCLEKDPTRRYASAQALADDLSRYLAGDPILARPVRMSERAVMWARRRPAIAGLLGLVALVSALGLGGVFWQWREAVVARRVSERESERANAQTELAEHRLYDVRMNFVQRNWEDYHGDLLQQGLDEQLPANQSRADRRGFEWFYWKRKISSGHITLKGHTDRVASVAYSPDGRRLASASSDKTVKVWDAGSGQETLTLKGLTSEAVGTRWVMRVVFSPDGKRIAAAGFKANSGSYSPVKVWDAGSGHETLTLKGHYWPVFGVAFSPDGRRIASASEDSTVKAWDAAAGQETLTLKGHSEVRINSSDDLRPDSVFSVAFSPDGRRLASGHYDGTVKVWDAASGQEILTLKGHTDRVASVAFSPDGRQIASASWDQTVKVWDARPMDDGPSGTGAIPR